MLHCSCTTCTYRKLKLEDCNFEDLDPNFSSLRNLETLTLADCIQDLRNVKDLEKLTHLTIHLACDSIDTLALVCPRNLQQLEIKLTGPFKENEIFAGDSSATDMVYCKVIATFVALTWRHSC